MQPKISDRAFTLSNPSGLYDPTVHAYTHVAEVPPNTRIVQLAGQVGYDKDGNLAPSFAAQTRQAFDNIEIALSSVNATLKDVYKLTVLVVDHSEARLKEWQTEANRAWPAHPPTGTLIPVPRLAVDGLLVEIEVVAAQRVA